VSDAAPDLAVLSLGPDSYRLRRATADDLPAIVALIAADQFGATRDGGSDLAPYYAAFEQIDRDPAQLLLVAADAEIVAGTMQLTFIPGLARQGSLRAQIEAVRVAEEYRGNGLGAAMFAWAIDEARRRGCSLVQLTSDKSRSDAHRFYDRLGFARSHDGFKLAL
jgi:GNAT superfamily N-acetyltransferase